MARGSKNYDKVVRKHNKGKTKSKARIAAVHQMVEAMIQGNTAIAGDAFNTYMRLASRDILGEGDDESKMTDDDNDESVDDTSMADDGEDDDSDSDEDMDDDSDDEGSDDEGSDEDMDDDSDDEGSDDEGSDEGTSDDVDVKIRQKMDEGKKGVNPFAKKGKKDADDDEDTGGDKFKKEKDKGLKSKPNDLSGDSKNARSSRRGGKGKK